MERIYSFCCNLFFFCSFNYHKFHSEFVYFIWWLILYNTHTHTWMDDDFASLKLKKINFSPWHSNFECFFFDFENSIRMIRSLSLCVCVCLCIYHHHSVRFFLTFWFFWFFFISFHFYFIDSGVCVSVCVYWNLNFIN